MWLDIVPLEPLIEQGTNEQIEVHFPFQRMVRHFGAVNRRNLLSIIGAGGVTRLLHHLKWVKKEIKLVE